MDAALSRKSAKADTSEPQKVCKNSKGLTSGNGSQYYRSPSVTNAYGDNRAFLDKSDSLLRSAKRADQPKSIYKSTAELRKNQPSQKDKSTTFYMAGTKRK